MKEVTNDDEVFNQSLQDYYARLEPYYISVWESESCDRVQSRENCGRRHNYLRSEPY